MMALWAQKIVHLSNRIKLLKKLKQCSRYYGRNMRRAPLTNPQIVPIYSEAWEKEAVSYLPTTLLPFSLQVLSPLFVVSLLASVESKPEDKRNVSLSPSCILWHVGRRVNHVSQAFFSVQDFSLPSAIDFRLKAYKIFWILISSDFQDFQKWFGMYNTI